MRHLCARRKTFVHAAQWSSNLSLILTETKKKHVYAPNGLCKISPVIITVVHQLSFPTMLEIFFNLILLPFLHNIGNTEVSSVLHYSSFYCVRTQSVLFIL